MKSRFSFKSFLCGVALSVSIIACSMGGKSYTLYERKDTEKLWRACEEFETPNHAKSICNRVCIKRGVKKDDCKEWKQNVKDFETEGHDFLKGGNYACVPEHYIYNL